MNVLFIAHKPEVLSQILQSSHSHSLMMVGQKEKKGKDILTYLVVLNTYFTFSCFGDWLKNH